MTKLAIITGGAQGIGLGLVRHFLSEGWRVAVLDIDAEALAELAAAGNRSLLPLRADVGKEAEVAEAFARLADWQAGEPRGIDLLVNNAGIANANSGPIEHLALADWQRWQDSHLTGTFLCTRAAVPGLRLRCGSIVNISSTRALQSEPNGEAYAAAKGGILSMTKSIARELARYNICANVISLGIVATDMSEKIRSDEKLAEIYMNRILLKKPENPQLH